METASVDRELCENDITNLKLPHKTSPSRTSTSNVSGVQVLLIYTSICAAVVMVAHRATAKWRFLTDDIVCSQCDEWGCANGTEAEWGGPVVFAPDHPWVKHLRDKPATTFPLGPSADVCVMRKNMITQLATAACRLEYRHLRRHGSATRNVYLPYLHFHSVHSVCMDSALKWAAERANSGAPDRPQLALIRDPIDRFISAYIQSCLSYYHYPEILFGYTWKQRCLNCAPNDVCCFARQFRRALAADQRHVRTLAKAPADWAALHVMPQRLHCNINASLSQYQLVQWDERRSLGRILSRFSGVPPRFFNTGWGLNGRQRFLQVQTGHETKGVRTQAKKALYGDEWHMALLRDIYKDDYQLLRHAMS